MASQHIQCIAQEELSAYPKSIQVLHHPFGGVLIVAVTHDNEALRLATHRKKAFFTVAELPTPNPYGEPLHVMRVPAPAPVTSLTLVRSLNGEDVFMVVQCCHAGSGRVETYLYRRLVETDDEDEEPYPKSSTEESATSATGCVSPRTSVVYQRLTKLLDSGAQAGSAGAVYSPPWTAAACLHGWERLHAGGGGGAALSSSSTAASPHYLAAASTTESTTSLHLISVTGPKASIRLTVEVDALSRFPVHHIVPLPGAYPMRFLCVCHNSLVDVDLGKHQGEGNDGAAAGSSPTAAKTITTSSNAVLRRAWRIAPEVSITSCTVRDCHIVAGTSSGALVLWDVRDERSAAATTIEGSTAPVTGVYATDAATFLSCSLDGTLLCWVEAMEGYGSHAPQGQAADGAVLYHPEGAQRFPFLPEPVELSTLPGEGWVDMAGDGNLVAVIGEFGTLQLFLRI